MSQELQKKPMTQPFVNMKEAIQDALKQGYASYLALGVLDVKIKVTKADPEGAAELPAVALNRVADQEVNQVLGDLFGYQRDQDIDSHIKKFGTDFRETIEIKIWTVNSDQRDILYALTKAILFDYRHYMALKYGLVNQSIVGGRDEANHVQYEGHFLYFGVIMFQAENAIQRNLIHPTLSEVDITGQMVESVVYDTSDV